ncbi:MAG: RNA polymerase sigma-54 factor [Micavibrio aeruginosavorus]|uniref:RNA polymerase sigma-54 factor n=1 Tax=Micavibrio aeruginosavorus TaxID=349221 RepID=A0A2W4ZV13_9BACT|nr:MAG: RNA polymerase sigma-54 factor [Micavibrio aeruginosavorus]
MSSINQRLDLRQSQNLVMTPQLQQAIKLLQLNNVELAEYIESEIAQNPLLEKAPPENESAIDNAPAERETDNVGDDFDASWTGNEAESGQGGAQDFDAGAAQYGAGGSRNFDSLDESFEESLSTKETLRGHLLEQMNVAFDDARDRLIGAMLIDMVDEAGYLREGHDDIAARLGTDEARIEQLLSIMKKFSPSGVFARDLKDCLAIQLEDQGKLDAPMKALLDNLHLLAGNDMAALAKKCDVNTLYLLDMVGDIKSLNPKPASNFDHIVVQTAIPDVLMRKLPKNLGGGWRVELNTETLPRVLVNNEYYTQVSTAAKDKKDREYITTQLSNANWLVRSLDQRAQTILKVASEIVEQQDAFFNFGIEFLRPLTLKDIAEAIDMHESTVSRVTTNKYIGTPRGIFELKYFFSTALVSSDGTAHSSESIKARIKTMIDAETAENILSDDAIVDALQKDGVDIARRTVAKYRDMLNIPSSVQRKKQKR